MTTQDATRLEVALEAGRVDEVLALTVSGASHRALHLRALLEAGRLEEARTGSARMRPEEEGDPTAAWLARAGVALALGALPLADRALDAAARRATGETVLELSRGRAELWRARGDPERGLDCVRGVLGAPPSTALEAHVQLEAARLHLALGRPRPAAALGERVLPVAREAGWIRAGAGAMAVVARASQLDGRDPERAIDRRARVVSMLRDTSLRWRIAYALLALGDARRAAADLDGAEQAYQQCLALEVQGHPVHLARLGVAMLAVEDGRVDEADGLLELVLRGEPGPRLRRLAESVRLATSAGRQAATWDRCLTTVRQLRRHAVRVDSDASRAARLAARRWEAAGDVPRAVQARALALLEADRVGDAGGESLARALRAAVEAGAPVPVGPWLLHRCVGRGVAGEVWAATRGVDGPEAAIKIVTGANRAREALQNELVAIASLEHRHICPLLDSGAIDAAAAAAGMPEGSPWLATELIGGGTLQPLCGRTPWSRSREILLALLDGLGYAHARGRLHLDVKPANVLLRRDGSPVLVDFGISYAMGSTGRATGTPLTMAPEQFRGAWREYGPHTDLYGLGILAWMLVTGEPPFDHEDLKQLAALHRSGSLPEVRARGPVPPDLGRWLARMLAKRPEDRYPLAVDAARALVSLGPPDARRTTQAAVLPLELAPPPPLPRDPPRADVAEAQRHAVPELVPRREPALVGQGAAVASLWSLLRSTRDGCAVAVIRSPTGLGASRLGAWVLEAGVRTGACVALSAACAPGEDATVRLAERMLVCAGLQRRALLQQVHRRAAALGWNLPGAFGARLAGAGEPLDDGTATALLAGGFAAMARDRPLVVHLDEAQWAGRALGLLEPLARSGASVLVVLSVDESLAEPEALQAIDALRDTTTVRPRELSDAELRQVVRSKLPLAPDALDWLVSAAGGRPGTARQLLVSWVQDAILTLGPEGYTFRPGLRPEAVAAMPAVQARRVVEALASERRRAVLALAVAGPLVDDERWRDLCARLAATVDAQTLAAVRRVATPEEGRWRFTSELARRALAAAADDELTRIVVQAGRDDAVRGVLADDDASVERALDELLRAVEEARHQGRLSAARTLLAEADRALRRLGAGDTDPRWHALHLERGALAMSAGELETARGGLEPLLAGPLGVDARLGLAEVALWDGDAPAAERWLVEVSPDVVDSPHEVRWSRLRARWLGLQGAADEVDFIEGALARHGDDLALQVSLGAALTRVERVDEAVRILEAALGPLRDAGSRLEVVRALVALGEAHRCAGRRRRAARVWEEALDLALSCEHPAGWTALLAVVLLRAEEGRVGEVLRLVERNLQRLSRPLDPPGRARSAWLRAVRAAAGGDDGAWREARSALSAAEALPEDARARSALAEVARANGRRFP